MKACQRGCTNLDDANNLLAECYGQIGKLQSLIDRLAKDAEPVSPALADEARRTLTGSPPDSAR